MVIHADKSLPKLASAEALFRYQVVSDVLGFEQRGEKRNIAVGRATKTWRDCTGKPRNVGKRTAYRWLEAYEGRRQEGGHVDGLAALEPAGRTRIETSRVLSADFLRFLALQKDQDVAASIPEVIRRARQLGIVAQDAAIDRSTVFRTACRMGIPTQRRKGAAERDSRPFEFPHRLNCVLVDGKHFRAGAKRARRVAFFFLDDATRCGLHVVVGTSENEALFLRGLYELIRKYGYMDMLYLDSGPGFIGNDTLEIVGNFPGRIPLIHGEPRYPEGHGKIERFNQTAKQQCLRQLDKRPDVDPSCSALELRIGHYLTEQYNHTPHEGLPWVR